MNILALESSGASVGIAAFCGADWHGASEAQSGATWSSSEPRALSREIMRGIDQTLQRAQWSLDDVDAFALGLGPGSWTSLRIGLATGKTLAQARNWRLIGVPTLDALAQHAWELRSANQKPNNASSSGASSAKSDEIELPPRFILLATAHCRAGEVYGKIFECGPQSLALLQEEAVGSPQGMADAASVEARARDLFAPLVLIGDGAASVAAVLEARGEAFQLLHLTIEQLAVEIARCGQALLESGRDSDALQLQPLYIAPSAAERNFKPKTESSPQPS